MSLRDELIEVAREAIAKLPFTAHSEELATAALDAILARLNTPTEEMLRAAHNAGDDYAFGDQIAWNEIPIMWKAMLSTLEPKT